MKYNSKINFKHGEPNLYGVLLLNLGTPKATTTKALRTYLKQFLSDPRIVEPPPPRWLWLFLLNSIILNIRPRKSAKAYKEVWDLFGSGSPLLSLSKNLAIKTQKMLQEFFEDKLVVDLAMRYGEPSVKSVLEKLRDKGVKKLLIIPLFPQYSAATTASCFDEVFDVFKSWRVIPEMRTINSFYENDIYIEAIAQSIESHQLKHGKPELLIFSYHGLPKRYLLNGDPYHCQCHATSRLVAEKLSLMKNEYMVTFQSRFGREPWLQPYIEDTLVELPKSGTKNVQVICPGFSVDCLETIEEIALRNKDDFIQAGGKKFSYINSLNDSDMHVNLLTALIKSNFWPLAEIKKVNDISRLEQISIRAKKLGSEV